MSVERDDRRRAPARQCADASVRSAQELWPGDLVDELDGQLAARAITCHALRVMYPQPRARAHPAAGPPPATPPATGTARPQGPTATEPGA